MITASFDDRQHNIHPSMQVVVNISNTNLHLLEWIHVNFGGKIKKATSRGKWKQVYGVWWYGINALPVLQTVYPYLIIKRRQAEIAIEFLKSLIVDHRKRRAGLDSAVHDRRIVLMREMRELNRRGIRPRKDEIIYV